MLKFDPILSFLDIMANYFLKEDGRGYDSRVAVFGYGQLEDLNPFKSLNITKEVMSNDLI